MVLHWCSALGRSSRPLAIDFLKLSGSWAPDPLQTLPQTVFAEQTFQTHLVFVNKRIKNTDIETIIINRNLVKHGSSILFVLQNLSKRYTGGPPREALPGCHGQPTARGITTKPRPDIECTCQDLCDQRGLPTKAPPLPERGGGNGVVPL